MLSSMFLNLLKPIKLWQGRGFSLSTHNLDLTEDREVFLLTLKKTDLFYCWMCVFHMIPRNLNFYE